MNRVYKVIWSKAKHCYVVTSEIARSVTKSASSARSAGRKGAAVLAMAALLFTAGGVLGEAATANVTDVSGSSEVRNLIIVTKDDGSTPNTIVINNVEKAKEADHAKEADYALKATGDGNGEVIHNTYARKADVEKDLSDLNTNLSALDANLSALDEQVKKNTEAVVKVGKTADETFTDLYAKVQTNADAVTAEATARKQADQNNLKIDGDGVVSMVKDDSKPAVNKLVLNKDDPNQITLSGDGIKVGLNSGVMDKDGFYAGGDDYGHAGAALKWDGSIKGAAGDFTVDTKGKVTAASGKIGTVEITSAGAVSGVTDLTVNGTFDSKTLSSTLDAKNDYTTINGGKTQSMNWKMDAVTGETKSSASTFDENGSNAWAKDDDSIGKSTVTADGISQKLSDPGDNPQAYAERAMSQGTDEKYSMVDTVKDGDKTNVASQTASESSSVVSGKDNESIIKQTETGIKSTATDGKNNASTNLSNKGFNTFASDGTNKTYTKQTATDIKNTAEKGMISHTAKNLVNRAYENMTNTVDNDLTTTVGGEMKTTVTGKVTEDYKSDLDTTVGGNETRTVEGTLKETVTGDVTEDYKANLDTTVTGDSSLSAENINNKATKALTNEAETITNKAHVSVTTQIGEGTAVKSVMDVKGIANTATGRAITNDAATITNTGIASVTNQVGDNKVLVETNQVKSAFGDTIYTTWDADGITNDAADKAVKTFTGNNTVISDNDGTTFENTAHSTAFKGGTVTKTTISGNTITTGKAVMDYANVTKDLSVGGDLNVDGNIETHDAVLSADSRQVVTGRQLYQTNERVDRLDNRIKKVGANAAALAALRPGDFNPDDKFSIAAGFGSYRNANAAALGLFYRPNENVLLSLGTSFGDGENMVNAGVSVKFGRGKSMAERRKEMADEVSSMRDEMRSQDERIAELEEMLKKQSELIEKLSKES